VLNPEEIRNASFSLLPTGYSPEQVDAVLNQVADAVASGEPVGELAINCSFELTDVGYAPAEVDLFFSTLTAEESAQEPAHGAEAIADHEAEDGDESHLVAEPDDVEDSVAGDVAQPDAAPQDGDEALSGESVDDAEDSEYDAGDEPGQEVFAAAPDENTWQAPTEGVLDLDLLCQAVDRTGETLASLRGFIDNEVGAMKLAVERQAHETAKRCDQLIAQAVAEATSITEAANTEISRANKAAQSTIEKERRELAKELKRLREECDAEVARKHAEADDYAAKVRADADRDRAEAQRTIENAIGMQASIAESLERARQQLTPSGESDAQLAA
jgi:DivIVA domain-containing protein